MKIQKTTKRPIKFAALVISIIALLAGVLLYAAWQNDLFPFEGAEKEYQTGESVINMERGQTEKDLSDALKENPERKIQNNQTDTPAVAEVDVASGKQQANVILTNAGIFNNSVSAAGIITNIAEVDGQCRFTFVNADQIIEKTSKTLPNPTSTACETVSFPVSELPVDGEWKVKVTYTSTSSYGVSAEKGFAK